MMSLTSSIEQKGQKHKSDARRFLDIFVHTIRKNYGISLILLGMLTLIHPISYYMSRSWAGGTPDSLSYVPDQLIYSYSLLIIPLAGLVAIVLLVRIFGYMHKSVEVDLWHSLPIRRSTLFLAKYAASAVLLLLPLLLIGIWGMAVLGSIPLTPGMMGLHPQLETTILPVYYLTVFMRGVMTLFAGTSMLLVIYVSLGSSFDAIAATFSINGLWPGLVALLYSRYASTVPGLTMDYRSPILRAIISMFSPIVGYFSSSALFGYGQNEFELGSLYWLLFGLICLVLAFVIYVRRPSEKAEALSTREPLYMVIRVLITLTSAFAASAIFAPITGSVAADVISLLIGSLLAHIIVELIVARGAKTLLRSMAQYAVTLILIAVIAFFISLDGFGINRYRPSVESLSAVVLDMPYNGVSGSLYLSTDEHSAEAELAIQIAENSKQKSRGELGLYKPYNKHFDRSYFYESVTEELSSLAQAYFYDTYPKEVNLAFIEPNGKTVIRTYLINFYEERELTSRLQTSELLTAYTNPTLSVTSRAKPAPGLWMGSTIDPDGSYAPELAERDSYALDKIDLSEDEMDAVLDMLRARLMPIAIPEQSYYYNGGNYFFQSDDLLGDYSLKVNTRYVINQWPNVLINQSKAQELGIEKLKAYRFTIPEDGGFDDPYLYESRLTIYRAELPEICEYIDSIVRPLE